MTAETQLTRSIQDVSTTKRVPALYSTANPCWSTRSWKMAMALRFRRNWASMKSQWVSHREVATGAEAATGVGVRGEI